MAKYKDGDVKEISDTTFRLHDGHGCMQVIEHYRWVTVDKKKCPTCGKWMIQRMKEDMKVVLND